MASFIRLRYPTLPLRILPKSPKLSFLRKEHAECPRFSKDVDGRPLPGPRRKTKFVDSGGRRNARGTAQSDGNRSDLRDSDAATALPHAADTEKSAKKSSNAEAVAVLKMTMNVVPSRLLMRSTFCLLTRSRFFLVVTSRRWRRPLLKNPSPKRRKFPPSRRIQMPKADAELRVRWWSDAARRLKCALSGRRPSAGSSAQADGRKLQRPTLDAARTLSSDSFPVDGRGSAKRSSHAVAVRGMNMDCSCEAASEPGERSS